MILERSDLPTKFPTQDRPPNGDEAGIPKQPSTEPGPEDHPPAYSQATQTTSSLSRAVALPSNGRVVEPFSAPINGLQMYTKREAIRGYWSLDPQAPLVPTQDLVQMILDGSGEKKRWCRSRSAKTAPPTAAFTTRHASIQATFRVVGDSAVHPVHSVTTIRSKTRSGNVLLDLVSIAPMRTVRIDVRSRRGNITLLVPRNFRGIVLLSRRHGAVEMLPALAASGRVIKAKNGETTVLLGDGPIPAVGSDIITDTARIYSRHGRVRLGFSGEDSVVDTPGLMDQALQVVHKLIMPLSQKVLKGIAQL